MQTMAEPGIGEDRPHASTNAEALAHRPRIETMRVAIVDNLLHSEEDFSRLAWRSPGFDARAWLKRDRYISTLALANIENNVRNLVARPELRVFPLSRSDAP